MNFSAADVVIVLAVAAMAALGGAAVVFSEFDDAPGGVLFGMLLIMGSVALGVRTMQRRR